MSTSSEAQGTSKCYECGAPDVVTKVEPRKMQLAQGWTITVMDTIVTRCCTCGEETIGYQSAGLLMKAIAAAVINKPKRLAGPEIRFLRDHHGMPAEEFAEMLGVSPGQLSRWENGKESVGVANDR